MNHIFNEHPAHRNYVVRLCAEKAAGVDYLLDLGNIGESEAFERRKTLKEHWRYEIYPRVGTLSRESDCYQQAIRLLFFKRTQSIRIFFFERRHSEGGLLLFVIAYLFGIISIQYPSGSAIKYIPMPSFI